MFSPFLFYFLCFDCGLVNILRPCEAKKTWGKGIHIYMCTRNCYRWTLLTSSFFFLISHFIYFTSHIHIWMFIYLRRKVYLLMLMYFVYMSSTRGWCDSHRVSNKWTLTFFCQLVHFMEMKSPLGSTDGSENTKIKAH